MKNISTMEMMFLLVANKKKNHFLHVSIANFNFAAPKPFSKHVKKWNPYFEASTMKQSLQ